MGLARIAVIALATVRVVETAKEALPSIPPPWQKSLFACAVGAGAAYIAGDREPETVALTGVAAAGLAAVVHDIQWALTSLSDNAVTQVLQRVPQRARPLTPEARPGRAGPLGT